MNRDPFFIVWCPTNPQPPRVRHPSREAAGQEAEWLARTHKGQPFIVLEAVTGFMCPPEVQRVNYRDPVHGDDDIPF